MQCILNYREWSALFLVWHASEFIHKSCRGTRYLRWSPATRCARVAPPLGSPRGADVHWKPGGMPSGAYHLGILQYDAIWTFPEIGIPPIIIHLEISIRNHPHMMRWMEEILHQLVTRTMKHCQEWNYSGINQLPGAGFFPSTIFVEQSLCNLQAVVIGQRHEIYGYLRDVCHPQNCKKIIHWSQEFRSESSWVVCLSITNLGAKLVVLKDQIICIVTITTTSKNSQNHPEVDRKWDSQFGGDDYNYHIYIYTHTLSFPTRETATSVVSRHAGLRRESIFDQTDGVLFHLWEPNGVVQKSTTLQWSKHGTQNKLVLICFNQNSTNGKPWKLRKESKAYDHLQWSSQFKDTISRHPHIFGQAVEPW